MRDGRPIVLPSRTQREHALGIGCSPRQMRLLALVTVLALTPGTAEAIPYWARKYGVTCSQCHTSVPKLNKFGGEFVARGYRMPHGATFSRHSTIPLAVWMSGRSDTRPVGAPSGDEVRAYLNRLELISGDALASWLSYFAEWRIISLEPRSDGTMRDRSGRFEDLYLTASGRHLELTVGQFRQIAQIDPSRRLGVNEPLVLGTSLAGRAGGTSREQGLRGFAPGARSPSLRLGWNAGAPEGWRWTTSAALPIPGEFSIPLNGEARTEASNEIEWRRKGIFVESFARSGPTSFGAHVFYDNSRRLLSHAIATGRASSLYWTGIGGVAKAGDVTTGRWSMEGEFIPHEAIGIGGRVEDRAGDKTPRAFIPYLNLSLPADQYTFRLTLERRVQNGQNATFLEFATIF